MPDDVEARLARGPVDRAEIDEEVELGARVVSAPRADLRMLFHAWAGNPQANGVDTRQTRRWGGDFRVGSPELIVQATGKIRWEA